VSQVAISEEMYLEESGKLSGWCVLCEEFIPGPVEPDALGWCPRCHAEAMYGIEKALALGYLDVDPNEPADSWAED